MPTYLRKILNQVFVNNNEDISLKTSADLVNISFCSFENISCVVGECQVRKSFTKLDELNIDQAHCSKKYFLENVNCSEKGHITKFKQFWRSDYLYKGETKQKIQLVVKELTPVDFVRTLKEKLKRFPRHWYDINHTSSSYGHAINLLSDCAIIKIQDILENCTCFIPNETMWIHWTQEQITVFQ